MRTSRIAVTSAVLTCAAMLVLGQQKPAESKPGAPALPEALKAKYFKASAQSLQAQTQMEQVRQLVTQRNTEFQAVVSEIQKACGEKFQPQIDKEGDPACVVKPEPAKAPEKK